MLKRTISEIILVLLLISVLMLNIDIQPVKASGTIYIRADGSIDPPTANITTTDNVTYYFTSDINGCIIIERDNIVVDGAGYCLRGTGVERGIDLSGRINVLIRNMEIREFHTGVYLNGASLNTIYENNITACNGYGILFYESSFENYVLENNITNNPTGVETHFSSSYTVISGNNIKENGIGIRLWSEYNEVSENNLTDNKQYGVLLYWSSGNIISRNNITDNNNGILVQEGDYNNILGNNLRNNKIGIYLFEASWNNISENKIITNKKYGMALYLSSSNGIYHNNFIENKQQIYIVPSEYANIWDDGYPSGGNFWSDYTDVDLYSGPYQNETGSDGIGDIPYVIYPNEEDRYPLMQTFPWVPHDIGVAGVTLPKTVVEQGLNLPINITVFNYGSNSESFNITVHANTTLIHETKLTLTSGNYTTIPFTWNTTEWAKGNYTIIIYAVPVPNERELSDNTFTIIVYLACFCDVDANGKVEAKDIALIISAYMKTEKSSGWYAPTWYSNYDVDCNGKVEAKDIAYAIANYGNKGC